MAFYRFAARRSKPSVIFSDNDTNFVGAERELKDALKSWNKTVLQEVMLKQQIIRRARLRTACSLLTRDIR